MSLRKRKTDNEIGHGWNSGLENIIKDIGEEANGYAWMNLKTSVFRKRIDNGFIFASIAILAVITLLSSFNTEIFNNSPNINSNATDLIPTNIIIPKDYVLKSKTNDEISTALNIVNLILGAIGGILLGCRQQFQYELLSNKNMYIYKKFSQIALDCAMILKLRRSERELTGSEFKKKIIDKYISYVQSTKNDIMDYYRKQYSTNYSKIGIKIPGQIEQLVISNNEVDTNNINNSQDSPIKSSNICKELTSQNINNIFASPGIQQAIQLVKNNKKDQSDNDCIDCYSEDES